MLSLAPLPTRPGTKPTDYPTFRTVDSPSPLP